MILSLLVSGFVDRVLNNKPKSLCKSVGRLKVIKFKSILKSVFRFNHFNFDSPRWESYLLTQKRALPSMGSLSNF
jgi:hypothetical protein